MPLRAQLRQTSADPYTRYELLDPSSQSFRIVYDVTATTAGARAYFNPIRKGSEPTVHQVTDLYTGEPLQWRLVSGEEAAAHGLAEADREGQYLEVTLARAVPEHGETRLRIDKTYKDPASYRMDGDRLVFERSLGIPRNAVVLPAGWELLSCTFPSQVLTEADGRLKVSFFDRTPGPAALRVEARRRGSRGTTPPSATAAASGGIERRSPVTEQVSTSARTDYDPGERAVQDREIVYFLDQPETHSFHLYHDYTESRPGVDRYVNVVRAGSRASSPSAVMLDTGEPLRVETLRGSAITERGIDTGDIGEAVGEDTEVVVIWFEPVKAGRSSRLRIEETYTDPGRYGLDGGGLLWDRSFGRPRNDVVLPAGWTLTASSIPAVIDQTDDDRTRLRFENDRPDAIDVWIRARRR